MPTHRQPTPSPNRHRRPSDPQKLKIPDFHPLPPTTLLNRIINTLLAPLFYLLFTVIVSIVVVPVYTAIRHVSGGGGGEKVSYGGRGGRVRASGGAGGGTSDAGPGEAARLSQWMKGYSDSASVEQKRR